MNDITIIISAVPAALGCYILAAGIAERRKDILRRRIRNALLGPEIATDSSQSGLWLDVGSPGDSSTSYSWLPGGLKSRLRAALAATGNRLGMKHLLSVAGLAVLLSYLVLGRALSVWPPLVALGAVCSGFAAPIALIRFGQKRFQGKFIDGFPDALDLIVRAVRAGLPVREALGTVGNEVIDPVGAEFRQIYNGLKIGIELEDELARAAERIRAVEFRFFMVALALQRQTGGNLTEALENLSMMIRRRREVRLKGRALLSESRASAWLIGILPFVAGGTMFFTAPKYIKVLFTTPNGKTLLEAAIISLVVGVIVMRSMIKRVTR